jgi:hypothetical protein
MLKKEFIETEPKTERFVDIFQLALVSRHDMPLADNRFVSISAATTTTKPIQTTFENTPQAK